MKSIEVSTKIFAAIWARRIEGEESENEILERVLSEHHPYSKLAASMHPNVTQKKDIGEAEMYGKIRWVDDIVAVLRDLGGEASLGDIYDDVRIRRKAAGRSVTKEYKATIRRTLEDHSSDSANHRAADLFKLIDRGVWAIR